MSIKQLEGKTLKSVDFVKCEITFTTTEGDKYLMYHKQDCCESVCVEDINGELTDLVSGDPVLLAEERSNIDESGLYESATWTFYTIRTVKATVVIRWLGESNGYYSESVTFRKI